MEVTAPIPAPGARGDLFDPACPTRQLLDRIGTKWTSMVVTILAEDDPDEVRFSDLRRRADGISQKMLSHTLKELAADGLVQRRVEPTVPPRVHYRLTGLGMSLHEPLHVLRLWAEDNMARIDHARAAQSAESSAQHTRADQ